MIRLSVKRFCPALLLLGVLPWEGQSVAIVPADQPTITSLSIEGTNLVFNAIIPPAASQAILEMRPILSAAWQDAAVLDVPAGGGSLEFIIPKTTVEAAFFPLRIASTTNDSQLSTELQYVTVPSLERTSTNSCPELTPCFIFAATWTVRTEF
jgi:hypothetical protein